MDYLIKLYDLMPLEPEILKLNEQAIHIRRALAPEKHTITEWIASNFSKSWASECEVSFSNHPISCFIATKGKAILGFECFDATCKAFLGPGGVAKRFRRRGIGRTLRLRCLHSMVECGYAYGIVGDGISGFAEKAFGAIAIPGSDPGFYKGLLQK